MTWIRLTLLAFMAISLISCGDKQEEAPAEEAPETGPEQPSGPPSLESILGPEEATGHPVVPAAPQVMNLGEFSVSFDAPAGWARTEGHEGAYHAKSPVDGHPMTTFQVQDDPKRPEDTVKDATDQLMRLGVKHQVLFQQPLPEDGTRFLVEVELPDGGTSVTYIVSLEPWGMETAFICSVIHKGSHQEAGFRALMRMCDTLKFEGFATKP